MTFNALTILFCLLLLATTTQSRRGKKNNKKNKGKKKNGARDRDRDAGSTVMVVDEWRSGSYFYYPGKMRIHKGNAIGKVSVTDNFCVRFDLVIHDLRVRARQFKSVFHIGNGNYGPGMRQPGVWILGETFYFRYGDISGHNRDYDPHIKLRVKKRYQFRFCIFNGEGKMYVDNRLRKRLQHRIPYSVYRAQIWVGDPWYSPAAATLSNLEVWSPTTHGETMSSKYR